MIASPLGGEVSGLFPRPGAGTGVRRTSRKCRASGTPVANFALGTRRDVARGDDERDEDRRANRGYFGPALCAILARPVSAAPAAHGRVRRRAAAVRRPDRPRAGGGGGGTGP